MEKVDLIQRVYGTKLKPFIQDDFKQFMPFDVILRYEKLPNLIIFQTEFFISFLEAMAEL